MFAMGLYFLHDTMHERMNFLRARFFWEGVGSNKKYHMVDWATVCKQREFGGLGIINTKIMNIALMLKWIWKLYQNAKGLWRTSLIRAKYLGNNDLFSFQLSRQGAPSFGTTFKRSNGSNWEPNTESMMVGAPTSGSTGGRIWDPFENAS
jgi:hypothetical protein